jgi:hypothetical protein
MSIAAPAPDRPARRQDPPSNAAATVKLTDRIVRVLKAVVRRDLRTRLAEFPVRLGIVLPLLWVIQAAVDWTFDLSWTTRRNLLCGEGAIVLYLFYVHVVTPIRKRLNLRTATLLIERTIPQFRTSLISAFELTASPTASPALVRILVQQVDRTVGNTKIAQQVIKTGGLKKRCAWMLLVLLGAGALAWYVYPKSLFLGRRLLLSHDAFPRRTTVRAITKDAVVPTGTDFEASAQTVGVIPKTGALTVVYDDGHQETIPLTAATAKPDTFSFSFKNVRQGFRYRFALNDDRGEQYHVTTRILLGLSDVHFTQTYPAYTGLPKQEMSAGNLALMAGSHVWIVGKSTLPLKAAALTLVGPGKTVPMQINGNNKTEASLDLLLEKNALTALSIHLVGANGEQSANDPVYRVDLTVDKPPVVTLRTPREEKVTVLANDKLPITFTARDDFGITKVELVYEIFHAGDDGGENPTDKGRVPLDAVLPDANAVRRFSWDLSTIVPHLAVGYSINLWIEATDNDNVFGPNIGRSKKKNVIVVSEEAKRDELLDALGRKASEIEKLYDMQHSLNQKTDSSLHNQGAPP